VSSSARIRLLADAVVALINANAAGFGTFGDVEGTIEAARVYTVKKDLTDLPDETEVPLVQVALGGKTRVPATREASQFEFAIDVAVRARVDTTSNTDADAVLDLAEGLEDFFVAPANRIVAVAGVGNCQLQSTEWPAPAMYVPDQMNEDGACVSVLRLNFISVA
jgi:hypothetical protein